MMTLPTTPKERPRSDDDAVQLPALDDGAGESELSIDLGENEQLAFDEDDDKSVLPSELDVDGPSAGEPTGVDDRMQDTEALEDADLEEAGALVPDDEGLWLKEEDEEGSPCHALNQEAEGLPEGEGGTVIGDPGTEEGVDDGAVGFGEDPDESEHGLTHLPAMGDDGDGALEGDEWEPEDDTLLLSAGAILSVGPTELVAPGVRWPRLQDVEVRRFDRPQGRAELCLHTVSREAPVLFLGALYRVDSGGPQLLSAQGLSQRPLSLAASAGTRPWLWALLDDAVQLSRDGGRHFGFPIRLPGSGASRGAAIADGTLWVVRGGVLYRIASTDLKPVALSGDEPVIDVASDGKRALLVIGPSGHLRLSKDAGRNFAPMPDASCMPQAVHLCGSTALIVSSGGLLLINERTVRQVFPSCVHTCSLAQIEGVSFVFACVRSEAAWLLVRIPVSVGIGVVLARLEQDVGVPRFVAVHAQAEQTSVVVGADNALVQVKVPLERD